jgi:hypothetical protein
MLSDNFGSIAAGGCDPADQRASNKASGEVNDGDRAVSTLAVRSCAEAARPAISTTARAASGIFSHMQFDDVILGRRSIRGYKPDPVPRALIKEVIALALRAPSSMNTQPWNFYVVTGEPRRKHRADGGGRAAVA